MIKSKIVMLSAIFATASLLMISCGSKPEAQPAPVEDTNADAKSNENSNGDDLSGGIDAMWNSLDSMRNDAINAGADKVAPEAFKAAEDEYAKLKKSNASIEELNALKARYAALKAFAEAKSKKEKIDELNLASYSQKIYDEGCSLISELDENKNLSTADFSTKALAANASMTTVLEVGLRAKAREERDAAVAAQKKANSVKCFVSRKAEYETFVNAFKTGDQNFVTKNLEGALEKYTKAKNGFENLYTEVSTSRAKAQAAIDEAKKRVAASEKTAEQADIDKPLGNGKIEGIEDAETVLLEEDDYSKSSSAEVDLTTEDIPAEDLVEKINNEANSVINSMEAK